MRTRQHNDNSFFDGGLLSYISWIIIGGILSIFTFGLAFPWAVCNLYRWEINHTVINGRRLYFSGTGMGLFGQWVKWWFLTIITFGIYGFWVHIKLLDWKARHTSFEEDFFDF